MAHYLAALCLSLTLLASPDVIVLGGGVLKRTVLFDLIRTEVRVHASGVLVASFSLF